MTDTGQLMPGISEDEKYEEEWKCIINTGGEYVLGKAQARVLLQEIATGNRGIVPFNSFVISIPYISEFYRVRRFLKDTKQLSARASELPYKPIPREKFEAFKKACYQRLGRKYEKNR